jgi:hypothetical protein
MVPISAGSAGPGAKASGWELITTNEAFLGELARHGFAAKTDAADERIQLWTDDYSNLFQILR